MEPTLRKGDRFRVAAAGRIRAGDVILFEASDHLVTHRVVVHLGGWIIHSGDAAAGAVGVVRIERVIGRVLLPRRTPPLRARMSATVRALGRVI
jgi:signal peptidase I